MFSQGKRSTRIARYGHGAGVLLVLGLMLASTLSALAAQPGNEHFQRTWQRTDLPVQNGLVSRTWMWGPEANTALMTEPYVQAPGGQRTVQYYDKARMEITDPEGDAWSLWYVTNGLLVTEMITGNLQIGDVERDPHGLPAMINVAGDADDPTGPTYYTFRALRGGVDTRVGELLTERVNREGDVTTDPALAAQNVTAGYWDAVTGHNIASPFWIFMNSSGPVHQDGQTITAELFENHYFATGRPITEAYWANVKVGGQYRDVLMQCFERRCLTYTPGNPEGFVVEAGNVGQHYYAWRYGDDTGNGGETPETPETPEPPMTATEYDFLNQFGLPDKGIAILGPNDVASAPNGDIYMTNTETFQVLRFNSQGILITAWGSEGAGNGEFGGPRGIAVDSQGNVYVVDKKNHRVQKFDPNGAFLLAFGEQGAAAGQFKSPHDVAIGPGDTVYVTDQGNNRIQKFNSNGGFLKVWGAAGTGAGLFAAPHGIDVNANGLVFVTDTGNDRVQIFDADGGYLGGFGQKGDGEGEFEAPIGIVAAQSGTVAVGESVYVTDTANDRVLVYTYQPVAAPTQSTLQSVSYVYSHELDGDFVDPIGADADPSGRIFIADRGNDRVQVFGSSGPIFGGIELVDTWVDDSRGRFSFDNPDGIDTGPDSQVYAIDNGDNVIKVFSAEGEYITQYGPALTSNLTLANPVDVAVDSEGFLYITDEVLDLVVKLDGNGEYIAQFGSNGAGPGQFQYPAGIALDDDGNIYVVDVVAKRVQKFGPDFSFISSWDGAGEVPFDTPTEIAIHGQRAYVTNLGNAVGVFVTDLEGGFLGAWEDFTSPIGIDVDDDGYVFVGDRDSVVTKLSPDGEIIVEFGRIGSGNGQIDTSSSSPRLALDAAGNVYIADAGNQRIVVFQPVS